jgi:hypothetical protein
MFGVTIFGIFPDTHILGRVPRSSPTDVPN